MTTLGNYGWAHSYPTSDPVHFDYSATSDNAQYNLMAFQKLYNINNPNNKISEDGIYGPATATALYNAPCNGYALTTFLGETFDPIPEEAADYFLE